MPSTHLTDALVEQIMAGTLLPADAPDDLRSLAELAVAVRGLAQSDGAAPSPLIASLAAASSTSLTPQSAPPQEKKHVLARIITAKTAAAVAALSLSVTGAAAATGTLPDAAQDGVAKAASHVGLNLPESASDTAREATTKSNGRPDHAGRPDDDTTTTTTTTTLQATADAAEDAPANGANEHGKLVSETARETDATGREHGEAVSTVARAGHGGGDAENQSEGRQDAAHRNERSTTTTTTTTAPGVDTADDGTDGEPGDQRSETGAAHSADAPGQLRP